MAVLAKIGGISYQLTGIKTTLYLFANRTLF